MSNLKASIQSIKEMWDYQPESAVWIMPVWHQDGIPDRRRIIDFQFYYCNQAFTAITGKPAEQIIGKCILDDRLPDPGASQLIFDQCLRVYETGMPLQYSYFSQVLGKYLTLQRIKIHGGILTTARNRTEEFKNIAEREDQAKLLESLVENSPYGISLYQSVRDGFGEIADFKLKLCNRKSSELTGLSAEDLFGKTVKELMLMRGHSGYFEICKKVVETGDPCYLEYHSRERDQWLGFSFVKFGDGYLLNYIDITDTKRYEQDAKRNAHELKAIFNGSLNGAFSAKLVRNENGKTVDITFLRANDSFYRMFPETEGKLIGESLLAILGQDNQSQLLKYIDEVMTTDRPAIHVVHYNRSDRWFEFSLVKLEEEMLLVTVNNITIQKVAAIEIERQKNLLDNIMRQSPNGLAVMKAIRDPNGKLTDVITVLLNEACERLIGVPAEVMLARPLGHIDAALLKSTILDGTERLAAGESFHTEYYLAGHRRWLELAVCKMDDEYFIDVFTDITTMKETQQQLEKSVADLRRSNENLENFAYSASHDLKEPIRKIRYFADRLKYEYGSVLDAGGLGKIDRLELAAERMTQLIDDLLEYSHVNQGSGEMKAVDLEALIKRVLEDFELLIQEKQAQVTLGNLPVISGNSRHLQQLFHNLIGNALKYHRPGEPPRVTVLSQPENGYHFIQVRDAGIGFDQKDAEGIFELFTRLHPRTAYDGTGIGLSIARKVVENHNGRISAESRLGEGATFNIYFPIH